MTSFGRQFDFHDVIYHIRHCNVDNRWRNAVFTSIGRSKLLTIDGVTLFLQVLDVQNVRKNTRYSLNKSCEKF